MNTVLPLFQEIILNSQQSTGTIEIDHPIYLYIFSGQAKFHFAKGFHIFRPNSLIYIPKWSQYSIESLNTSFHYSIIQLQPVPQQLPQVNNPYGYESIHIKNPYFSSLIRLGLSYSHPRSENINILTPVIECIHELFIQEISAQRIHTNLSPHMQIVEDYIHNHLSQAITVKELAKICQLSESHFSHKFKQEFSMSPTQYIKQAKLNQAYKLVHQTKLSITDIYKSLGYHSQAYFFQSFKQKFGLSPNKMRHLKHNLNDCKESSHPE